MKKCHLNHGMSIILLFSSRLETSHFLLGYTGHCAKKLHKEIGHLITSCPMKRQVNRNENTGVTAQFYSAGEHKFAWLQIQLMFQG